jgi:hypothetical protein
MWAISHSLDTPAAPASIWRYLADVDHWGVWNDGVEAIELHGPFASGSTFTMTTGGEEIRTTITIVEEPSLYVDETEMGDVVVRVVHVLDTRPSGGTRLTFRLEVDGSASDELGPQIGPAISADFPAVMAKLARLAES